jgi:hypothetical protein
MGIVGGPPTVRPTTQRKKSTKLPSTMLILASSGHPCSRQPRLSLYTDDSSSSASFFLPMLDWKQVVGRPMLKLRCSAAVTECKTASYG